MLNIKINNEEVVSNKDFTIQEEMLNTPSVILNNVYPKTWEQDKDYVSRFYHPNDYSKCVISNDTYYPEEQGTTVENPSFSINNVDLNKNYDFTTFKGQTTQSGTPTPSSPVEVNTVTGRQDVNVVGKNWLSITGNSQTINGITFTVNEDGSIRAKGLASANATFTSTTLQPILPSTLYRLSGCPSGGSNSTYRIILRVRSDLTTNLATVSDIGNGELSNGRFTTGATAKYILGEITIYNGQDVDLLFKPQVELIANSTTPATTYEAYKGNTYEINLGKNLWSLDNSYENTTSSNKWVLADTNFSLPKGTYTVSCNNTNTSSSTFMLNCKYNDNTEITTSLKESATITFTQDVSKVAIRLSPNTSISNIMLEKGSTATEYAEYKTPIELCKIGNYQDFIRKGTGKNILDSSTIAVGFLGNNGAWAPSVTSWNTTDYIPIETETNYVFSFTPIKTGTYWQARTVYYDANKEYVSGADLSSYPSNYAYSITTPSSVSYMRLSFTNTGNYERANLQLEKGTQITLFEPYDFNDKWYIYKATNKVDLSTLSWTNATTYAYSRQLTDIKYTSSNQVVGDGIATNYRLRQGSGMSNTSWSGYMAIDTSQITINPNNVDQPAKGVLYYVLNTPTAIEIEDSELITQLNGIELIQGLNNINIDTPYLPFIMTLHYNYVIEHTDSDILFSGVVKNSGNISLNPRDPHYQTLQILSYKTFLSEGETLDFVIYQKTIKEAIEQVVGVIASYGFVVGNINLTNENDIIGAYSTKDKTAYDVFNYIADITQSRWTTRLIDENTVAIDFYDPTLLPLGVSIDYTNQCFDTNKIDDMSYSYGSNDYRNKQVMTSQEVYSNITQTQTVVANGYQTQFNVEQKIGRINSIKISGTAYNVATNQEKEMGVSADFYYTPGNNYFESATTIGVGTSIVIEYIPIVEGRQIIANSTEIDRVASSTGVKGVVARYENRNDATTSLELQKIGQSYIKYKGVPEIILTVQTRSNLWNVGDRVPFNAPIDELKTEYMVKSKKINYITTIDTIFYTYEMTSSFNSENAINYFDNQRAKATGNIGEGEYISRNIDIQSDANIIFYETTATEITVVGDNTLEAVLEAPFVS